MRDTEERTVDEVVKHLLDTGESINAYVHNTSIRLKRIREKGMQTYRFYGGEEAEQDRATHDFYMEVLVRLTEKSVTLRRMYNIPSRMM